MAEAFEGKSHPSVLVQLNTTKNLDSVEALLNEHVVLEGEVLEISTATPTSDLNQIFGVLARQELIVKLE
ncbi:ABC transporter ATP-binding protein, partial [Streptococcus suis]